MMQEDAIVVNLAVARSLTKERCLPTCKRIRSLPRASMPGGSSPCGMERFGWSTRS